ncbi:hypothetical protein JXB28_03835 [Candidatus Woesearchaeota archaeon]|nr:hypothetical protein [Candidatus Woesearchaeota archaeon]
MINRKLVGNPARQQAQWLALFVTIVFLGLFSTARFFGNEYLVYIHNHPSYPEPSVFNYNYGYNSYNPYASPYSGKSFSFRTSCTSWFGCPNDYRGFAFSYTPQTYTNNYAQPWYLR